MNLNRLKEKVADLKKQIFLIYFISRDPRLPLYLKFLAVLVAAYAFSPIDLIPDFIPVIGLVDDLLILPLGIALVIYLTPKEIIHTAQEKAALQLTQPVNYQAAIVIIFIWLVMLIWLINTFGPRFFAHEL